MSRIYAACCGSCPVFRRLLGSLCLLSLPSLESLFLFENVQLTLFQLVIDAIKYRVAALTGLYLMGLCNRRYESSRLEHGWCCERKFWIGLYGNLLRYSKLL